MSSASATPPSYSTSSQSPAPLDGVRVVEWGEMVSAPFCAKVLAEMGADVVKVEPPEGDAARHAGPFPGGVQHPERSGLFLFANLGKRG